MTIFKTGFLITALIILGLIIIKGLIKREKNAKYDEEGLYTLIASGIAVLMVFFVFMSVSNIFKGFEEIANIRTYKRQMEICIEENANIETKIQKAIQNYMEHENKTLTELSVNDPMFVIQNYPELKSDVLIAREIETYMANTAEIKTYKNKIAEEDYLKWKLYFGGSK